MSQIIIRLREKHMYNYYALMSYFRIRISDKHMYNYYVFKSHLSNMFSDKHMAGSSQPQHFFAAALPFAVFGALNTGSRSLWIPTIFWIFLFEVLKRSDFLEPYRFDLYLWLQDPPKW